MRRNKTTYHQTFMPFFTSAQALVAQLRPLDPMRVLLEYLLKNGVGHANARPWRAIEQHFIAMNIPMKKEQFQQSLLKATREGDIFIGSNDHNPGRGYFLIQTQQDAEIAREFYVRRIHVQEAHLNHLNALMNQQRWGALGEPNRHEQHVAHPE
jgi:hypothetical protein